MAKVIYPYKMGSRSAKALANVLGCKRVKPDGKYRPKITDVIINWGSSTNPNWLNLAARICNHPENVAIAANKLRTLIALRQANIVIPDFTTDRLEAQRWVDTNDGTQVIERHTLSGHSGAGIVLKVFGDDISPAPLYTKYIKKQDEYRVHVVNGEVIDVQQKRRRREVEDDNVNYQVRNHQNGWNYCRDGIQEPNHLREIAVASINALGLDFGAVDLIYNKRANQLYVLEINTACGLEGTTVTKYVNAFQSM